MVHAAGGGGGGLRTACARLFQWGGTSRVRSLLFAARQTRRSTAAPTTTTGSSSSSNSFSFRGHHQPEGPSQQQHQQHVVPTGAATHAAGHEASALASSPSAAAAPPAVTRGGGRVATLPAAARHWWSRHMRWRRALTTLHSLRRTSTGNTIDVFYDTGDAFRAMWAAVDGATTSIKWQTYICKDDNVGKITMAKLEAAQRRGVAVELLYDTGGNITGRAKLVEGLRSAGATVIAHRSFLAHIWWYFARGLEWENSPAIRNHRKILIVDGAVAFAGGLNIGDDYCAVALGGNGRFRDTMCRVAGPAVVHLEEVYEDTKTPAERGAVRLQRWRHWVARAWRWRLHGAPERHVVSGAVSARIRTRLRLTASTIRSLREGASGGASGRERAAAAVMAWRQLRQWSRDVQRRQRERLTARLRSHRGEKEEGEKKALLAPDGALQVARRRARAAQMVLADRARHRLPSFPRAARRSLSSSAAAAASASASASTLASAAATSRDPAAVTAAPTSRTAVTQVLSCNPERYDWGIQKALWVVVRSAEKSVWVTTPYYAPHRKLVKALIGAARRGVDVRILAGSATTTDPFWMWYASQYLSRRLLRAGVKIYEFHGGQILHAKTIVVDSHWASVGSYNWDVMSNKLLEVCVTEDGAPLAAQLEAHFAMDLAKAKPLSAETYERHSWFLRFQCWAAYHFMMKAERLTFWTYKDPDLTSRLDV